MMSFLRMVSSHALASLAEPSCAACEASVPVETVFCGPCARTLVPRFDSPRWKPTHTEVAAFDYGGALRDAIVRFKYQRRDDLARPLAALLARCGPRVSALRPDLVVPVPSHPTKLALRTFDPAALLARAFAATIGARSVPDALDKVRVTRAQAGLDREARLVNLEGAYLCPRGQASRFASARVVLVDDVRTTGATLLACHEALERVGAKVVAHAVLAIAPE